MTMQYRLTVVSRIAGTATTRIFKKSDDAFTQFKICMEVPFDYAFICMSEAWKDEEGLWIMGRILHSHVSPSVIEAMKQSAGERASAS